MASISTTERAAEILKLCLAGQDVPDTLLLPLVEAASGAGPQSLTASQALFGQIAEPMADRFEPALCEAYAKLFSRVISRAVPELNAADLLSRYERVRRLRRVDGGAHPDRVYVLSRVTLGAEVAVTSILLDAAKKRFPTADIILAGSEKCWELFAGDSRIGWLDAGYRRRGTLEERLRAGLALRSELSGEGSIVLDPDSRLSQLGLLPLAPENQYYFFESRSYGNQGSETLSQLTQRWVAECLGVVDALPYVAPRAEDDLEPEAGIAVSLGVGENPDKRIAGSFEADLLRGLRQIGLPILVDKGAGGEEGERVTRAIEGSGAAPGEIRTWEGAFAPFATRIARSKVYVGYDSAGQHVATAAGTPAVLVFGGYPCQRFFERWRPSGSGPVVVVQARKEGVAGVLERTVHAARRLSRQPG